MVEKPAYCTHCRHAFEYDTHKAKADMFRYVLACPRCGKENRRLRPEFSILLESAGVFLGFFLGWYFLLHESLFPSLLFPLIIAAANGITSYYFRVRRPERAARKPA